MKHLLLFFVLTLMLSTQAVGQETYEILRIYNAENITIGNRPKKAGDTFKSTDQIVFSNDRQSFKAQKKGTSKAYYFNKKAMEAKKSKTLKDYLSNDYNKLKGSSRRLSGNSPTLTQGLRDSVKYREKRIALVIGNGNYQEMNCLPNALNDARDVSDTLRHLGFDVMTLYDGDINDMTTSINSFFILAKEYQIALIYFAGHGIRYDEKDYILSIDREGLEIKNECSVDYLLMKRKDWMDSTKKMILIIDACRTNLGFPKDGDDNYTITAPYGTVIMQSTASDKVAMDAEDESENSLFASIFIRDIGMPYNIVEVFNIIQNKVMTASNSLQVPHISFGVGFSTFFTLNFDCLLDPNCFHIFSSIDSATLSENILIIQKDANKGFGYSQSLLGHCYFYGYGVPKSFARAFYYYQSAALQGDPLLLYNLGILYFNGYGTNKNYSEAVKCFSKAAELDETNAQYYLGYCYAHGYGVNPSDTTAFEWYRKAAEQGHVEAQYNLGQCYAQGIGIVQSYSAAYEWYFKAAEQGNDKAQYNLALYYENGQGTTQSYTKAAEWYHKAADQNHAKAQYRLGLLYEKGQGVIQSYTEAFKWYNKSCNKCPAAHFRLGWLYENGLGVPQSDSMAFMHYFTSTKYGDTIALKYLGGIYPTPAPQYHNITEYALLNAANKGNERAQYSLGMYYKYFFYLFEGYWTKDKINQAKKLFLKAAEQGHEKAKKELESMQ